MHQARWELPGPREDRRVTTSRERVQASDQANFHAIFQHAAIGIALVDMGGHPVQVNPALVRILGYSADELREMVFTDFTHPEDAGADWALFEELVAGRRDHYQMEKRYFRPDGSLIWGHLTVSLIRDEVREPAYAIGMVNDITERKQAEESSRKSEERFGALLESAPDAALVIDPEGLIELVNAQAEHIFGYNRDELLGQPVEMLLPERHRAAHARDRGSYFADPRTRPMGVGLELAGLRKDGTEFPIDVALSSLATEEGPLAIAFVRDITDRKLAEKELCEAEAKYRTLVEQLPAIVYLAGFGLTGEWLYVSPQIREVFGYTPKEWMREPDPLASRLHPEDRDWVLREEARCQTTGEPFGFEYRVHARDGSVVWVRDEAIPVQGTPDLWQGVMFDVTERKREEGVLRTTVEILRATDQERRRLLSRLVEAREEEHRRIAADVHDGPVQKMVAVGLRLEMLRRRLGDPEDLEVLGDLAKVVEESTRELRHLLFELSPRTLETGGLAEALRAFLHELAAESGLRTNLEDRLQAEPTEPARTVCYRIAQEALRNVSKHAEASKVQVLLESSEEGTRVRITDDGCGFEPDGSLAPWHFGLAGMYERAESSGGWLKIRSGLGKGTTVEFWLPDDDVGAA